MKSLDAFPSAKNGFGGVKPYCRECQSAYQKQFRANNPLRVRQWKERYWAKHPGARSSHDRSSQLKQYGITPKEYDALLEKQGGVCAICGTDKPGGNRSRYFHVDHCHETGAVRGLLCSECNLMLGKAHDSVERLQRAIRYLEESHE